MYQKIIFTNLRIEMARKCLTMKDISEASGIVLNTLKRKLYGITGLLFEEASAIQRSCFPECEMEYLFEELL